MIHHDPSTRIDSLHLQSYLIHYLINQCLPNSELTSTKETSFLITQHELAMIVKFPIFSSLDRFTCWRFCINKHCSWLKFSGDVLIKIYTMAIWIFAFECLICHEAIWLNATFGGKLLETCITDLVSCLPNSNCYNLGHIFLIYVYLCLLF